jgi:hypothetical protein
LLRRKSLTCGGAHLSAAQAIVDSRQAELPFESALRQARPIASGLSANRQNESGNSQTPDEACYNSLESECTGVARLQIAPNSGHELEKRYRGASSSLRSLSASEWLAFLHEGPTLKLRRSPRVEVFLVDLGEQLISSLHVRTKSQRVLNSERRRPVTPSTERRLHP